LRLPRKDAGLQVLQQVRDFDAWRAEFDATSQERKRAGFVAQGVMRGVDDPRLVAVWLAFGLLLSVVVRRAATAALIGFGVWLLLTIFGGLITSFLGGLLTPAADASADTILGSIQLQELITRLLPSTLYNEISLVLLNPSVTQISTPATIDQFQQSQQQIPTLFSLDQSFILIWPQVVGLVALTVACFALAYVLFMRQEVRA